MVVIEGLAADLATASLALARGFHAGGTLWCWSGEHPHHAHHVAVEFVHPVIMGKRALPAIAVDDPDPAGCLRVLAAPPDMLLAIGDGREPDLTSLLRRARVWGLETVWLGGGDRPDPGAADHVLWLEGQPGRCAHDGYLVRLYHLLWELTHVCFEHPGLLARPAAACDDGGVYHLCRRGPPGRDRGSDRTGRGDGADRHRDRGRRHQPGRAGAVR